MEVKFAGLDSDFIAPGSKIKQIPYQGIVKGPEPQKKEVKDFWTVN